MTTMYVNTETFMNHTDHIISHTALLHEDHHATRDETNHHELHMFCRGAECCCHEKLKRDSQSRVPTYMHVPPA
jgi:hypothetical protein